MARTVTALLRDWRRGDAAACDRLMTLVYDELHRLAARQLHHERPGHTFQPTDLVSEVYLRLSNGVQPEWIDRVHFFAIAARSMRQVLVDHARKHRTRKRGSGASAVAFEDQVGGVVRGNELLALDEALTRLAVLDERKARMIEMRYFAGLSHDEIAEAFEVHVNTVARSLKIAEAWIHRSLQTT